MTTPVTTISKLVKDGIDPNGEPVKAPRWKNLNFMKDGKSYHGVYVWPSEQKAFEMRLGTPPESLLLRTMEGIIIKKSEIAHVFQIPWSKP